MFSEDPSVAGSTAAMVARPQGEGSRGHEKYDLSIKGGTVIDRSQDLHIPLDSAAVDGEISGMSPNMPEGQADVIFVPKVRIVTPRFRIQNRNVKERGVRRRERFCTNRAEIIQRINCAYILNQALRFVYDRSLRFIRGFIMLVIGNDLVVMV